MPSEIDFSIPTSDYCPASMSSSILSSISMRSVMDMFVILLDLRPSIDGSAQVSKSILAIRMLEGK